MQYVWQYRLWPARNMHTVDRRRIEVLDTGTLNRDAGPDFFNAKLLIDGQTWIGDVEMHVRASDWHRHGHDNNRAYDSVILHVVEKDDAPIRRSNGEIIPQMVMACARDFSQKYHEMVNSTIRELPCGDEISTLPSLHLHDWITALAYERLFTKSDRVADLVHRYAGNWTDAVYVTIARALGFSTNAEPFEILALTTPLKYMLKHSDSLLSIEALLFGQAGLLKGAEQSDDHYVQRLIEEYNFLSKKYGLTPSQNIMWKMSRMRPQNFPHRRIALLAMLIYKNFTIASSILNIENEEQARQIFDINLVGYWARHYNFTPTNATGVKGLGYSSVTGLIINAVVPILYAYGETISDTKRQEHAIEMLQALKPENNTIIETFQRAGLSPKNAFTTQALIQLKKNYCTQRKCIFCRIGHKLLSEKVSTID